MSDTPENIKDIQLKIWLSKEPAERLKQFLIDNEALYSFWNKTKDNLPALNNHLTDNDIYEEEHK